MRQYEPEGGVANGFEPFIKDFFFLNWKMLKNQETSAAQDIEVILFSLFLE